MKSVCLLTACGLLLLLATGLTGCTFQVLPGTPTLSPEPAVEQRALNATLGTAVAATLTALAPTSTPSPTASPTSTPTLTPTPTLTSTPTPKFTPTPEGWTRHTGDGFEIWLPDNWQSWEITPETMQLVIETVREVNPDWAEMMDLPPSESQAGALLFFAFDRQSKGGLTTLNIVSATLPIPLTIDMLVPLFTQMYTELGARVISTQSDLEINGLEAAAIRYDLALQVPEQGEVVSSSIQYVVLGRSVCYALTFSTDAAQMDAYTPVFESIAWTFRVVE